MSSYRNSPARPKLSGEYGSVSIVARTDLTNTIKRFDAENPEVSKKSSDAVDESRAGRNFVNLKNVLLISLGFFILMVCIVFIINKKLLISQSEDGLVKYKSSA